MIGRILGNRYEIVEKIGGGGMALVYKAKCNLLNRYVAVKILRSEFTNDKDIIEKFKRESQAAASLSHPNIVNLYDVGEEEDIYYIVMEYVKGKTLKEVIKEKEILTLEEIINYTKQIALALQQAHYNHVIHRDIKPHNILITEDNRAKVTDFGIALAATSSTITNMGSVIGSVHYFSPEQARGGYTDEKSDLYSLGIVMYEMATGKVPFEGDSPISVALKHIQEEPVLPSEVNPQISKGLEEIILQLIQKDQASRYQNTQSLIEDLNKLKQSPDATYVGGPINHEDSPTQIIPRIKEEDIQVPGKKPQNKKKRRDKLLITSAVIAALIAALLFVFGLFYVSNIFRTEEVEVPNFVGMDIETARQQAVILELELSEETTHSKEVPIDEIIRQYTSPGMKVRPGATVKVLVSEGPRTVTVPDLRFEDETNVPYILENAGLEVGTPRYEFSDFPKGVIIEQNPRAGASAVEGTIVDYVVSQGPQEVTFPMPNLIGGTIENARNIIEQFQLQKGSERQEYNDEYPEGLVIDQSIAPGSMTRENALINLTVSRGPKPVQEPGEEDIELDIKEDEEDDQEDSINTSTTNTSTKNLRVELQGYTGLVSIRVRNVSSGEEVYNKNHDVSRDGETVMIPITGREGQEFELYINNKKHNKSIIL
ncbi:Stk1 family PASTA domain-containing Ser/Thr kinase [Natronincola ferrireducens]|uniref:non-specific serine/threonine protein kinase n=1 Tax=Natronincola ferrireducens TaxID=393762 RepID=A0A1G9BUT3_9FIRM|nr:Stk1 family PASTA domain-containing Ser/Thr kinase [Natronincola ferrireducens]SDK43143.1 serine/threonine protein kinase [Natronincola ferrireducens]